MDNNANFIVTKTDEACKLLLSYGLQEIQSSNNTHTFLNCVEKLNFAEIKDCVFTNKLCI